MDSEAYRKIFLVTGSIHAYNSYAAAKATENNEERIENNAADGGRDSAEKR